MKRRQTSWRIDEDIYRWIYDEAHRRGPGVTQSDVVNEILRKEIEEGKNPSPPKAKPME